MYKVLFAEGNFSANKHWYCSYEMEIKWKILSYYV